MYDENNVFAKIIRGEIPNNTVNETDDYLAFHDINPESAVHVLVIPKQHFIDYNDFIANASESYIIGLQKFIIDTVKKLGIYESGYSITTNNGKGGGQEVFHLHFHIKSSKINKK